MAPKLLCLALSSLLLTACAQTPSTVTGTDSTNDRDLAVSLTKADKKKIGQRIWQNESGGTIKGLTHWNDGEEFPSMGIGHFIWYPQGFQGRWTESFPKFIAYAKSRGIPNIPSVALLPDCPWRSKAEFQRDFNGPRLSELRGWLSQTVELQTDYIIALSRAAVPEILAAAPPGAQERIRSNYNKVSSSPNGIFALIDYTNFKGVGTNPEERYNGKGWGVLWVLYEMKDAPAGQPSVVEFSEAAKRCLDRRIANSPPARGEQRWRAGWHNRCESYKKPL